MHTTDKMNLEIKARWTARLRSGQDQQAKYVLKREDGAMCCLGVLSDIARPNLWGVLLTETLVPDETISCYRHLHSISLPNSFVMEDAGLAGIYMVETDDDENESSTPIEEWLAEKNDDGATFTEIADLIDEYL